MYIIYIQNYIHIYIEINILERSTTQNDISVILKGDLYTTSDACTVVCIPCIAVLVCVEVWVCVDVGDCRHRCRYRYVGVRWSVYMSIPIGNDIG